MNNKKVKSVILFAAIIVILSGLVSAATISVDTAAVVNTNTCDKITWTDSSGLQRTGSVVKVNGNLSGYKGGYFSQITYMDGVSPVACNEANPAGDLSGLGHMINHQPTGYAGRGWANSKQDGFNGTTSIIFQGANHVIYQAEMDMYGDNGNIALGAWKVKWIYMIRTGNDYIVDSIAYDFSSEPYGTYGNDMRSPYCELNWTGTGASNTLTEPIDGIEFCATNNSGVSYIFKTNSSSPFSDGYTYNTPGRNIAYTLQWKNSPDREIGYVATLDLAQQAAAGGYLSGPVNIGSTSATMPPNWAINYQSNGFQGWYGDKMTWGMPYGAAGGETAAESGTTTKSTFPDWTWRKNWPAYPTLGYTLLIHLGKKTDDNVRKLMNEEEDIHGLVNPLTASTGTVPTTGKMNLYDTAPFILKPAGYNHLYHAWEVVCDSDQADVAFNLGAVTLENQTFIFTNFSGSVVPAVLVDGVAQTEGVDMFTSLDTTEDKLYITFNKSFTGTVNIVIGGAAWTPTSTYTITPYAGTPTMTPTLSVGGDCLNLYIDRSSVPSLVFKKDLTLKVHIGDCSSVIVTVDGIVVPSIYDPATKICMFTADGDDIVINRRDYTGGATNTVTKATLRNDKKWTYSFTFDDGRPNARLVAMPILESYGYKAGVAINTQSMTESSDGYVMSWQSLDILYNLGWSVFNHNFSHQAATCANISTETLPVKTAIEARYPGYINAHFVYPYVDTTEWTCIRDSGYFLSAEVYNGNNYADVMPISPFLLNRNSMMPAGNAGTAALADALADNAASDARNRWMIMFTHDVSPGSAAPPTTYDTNEDTFGSHIAYVYNTYGAGGLDNMWFAPSDTVMQYIYTRENAVVNVTGSGPCGAVTPATSTATQTNTPYYTVTETPVTSDCLMDDMEHGGNTNLFGGYWYTYADGNGTSVWPDALGFVMSSGGYNSSYASRMTGTVGVIAAPDYPSIGMGAQLNSMAGAPPGGTGQVTDISGCGGISFWTKGNGRDYIVKIPYTDVDDNTLTGYDDYKYTFTAPASWAWITLTFSQFTQAGWGTTVPQATVLANAKAIMFQTGFNATADSDPVDLWIDNLVIEGCHVCPGAAVPTATNTRAVNTATSTVTLTGTFTSTATETLTTDTPTGTDTPTHTETDTFTEIPTDTPTYTPTEAATIGGVLEMQMIAIPNSVITGQQITIQIVVSNTGTGAVNTVVPGTMTLGGTGAVSIVSGPSPAIAEIGAGITKVFTYIYNAAGNGPVIFCNDVSGTDASYGGTVFASNVCSNGVGIGVAPPTDTFTDTPSDTPTDTNTPTYMPTETVTCSPTDTPVNSPTITNTSTSTHTPTDIPTETPTIGGNLVSTLAVLPVSLDTGRQMTVIMTVQNNGSGPVNFVSPGPLNPSNASLISAASSLSGSTTINNGSSAMFTWIFNAVNPGTLTFDGNAAGIDASHGGMVMSVVDTSNAVNINVAPTNTPTDTFTGALTHTPTGTPTETPSETPTETSSETPTISVPTAAATEAIFKINGTLVYPNPCYGSNPLSIKYKLTQNAKNLKLKVYTPACRLVRIFNLESSAAAGESTATIHQGYLRDFSSGTYYYVITGESESGGEARSLADVLVILK